MEGENDRDPSELGKLSYWEAAYERELHNFEETGDEGEIWFGEDTLEKSIDFMDSCVSRLLGPDGARHTASVLDVGTGNGVTVIRLAQLGYKNLLGTDYSCKAIALAQANVERAGVADSVKLQVDDLLDSKLAVTFDVVIDKGTFDAVGLAEDGKTRQLGYKASVHRLLKTPGLLVLTSCNSTKEELIAFFCATHPHVHDVGFELYDTVKYPTIQFGGYEGARVATVGFLKK